MKNKEVEQFKIFEKLTNRLITQKDAAVLLNLSERQVRKKFKKYKEFGAKSLIHKNKGKPSKRLWAKSQEDLAIKLLESDFKGFGPTFAAEKLKDLYNISVSPETLRNRMMKNGLWLKKIKRSKHRTRRVRSACFGLMIQLDGSPHDWFEGRAPKCTLLVFIDDATSKIVWLEFAKSESVKSLMNATRHYLEVFGRPNSFYVDYGSVFSVNTNNPERDKLTQFERAMKELDIRMIHASSPQAKGRVERVNKTLQDRLVKEMRLRKISSMNDANKFIQSEYISIHNNKFSVAPAEETNVHRSLLRFNLNNILCYKEYRILQNDFVLKYKTRFFQLDKEQKTIVRPKEDIEVFERLDGSIFMRLRATEINFHEIHEKNHQKEFKTKPLYIPPSNHPWRQYNNFKNLRSL